MTRVHVCAGISACIGCISEVKTYVLYLPHVAFLVSIIGSQLLLILIDQLREWSFLVILVRALAYVVKCLKAKKPKAKMQL